LYAALRRTTRGTTPPRRFSHCTSALLLCKQLELINAATNQSDFSTDADNSDQIIDHWTLLKVVADGR